MAERQASTKRRSAREWQSLVSRLAESGEGLAQFCGREGIYPPTLRWWQWHLRGSDSCSCTAAALRCSGQRQTARDRTQAYLRALFERLPSQPANRLHELAPALWGRLTGRLRSGIIKNHRMFPCAWIERGRIGWRDWGWVECQRLDFSPLPSFGPRAETLVRRRKAGVWTWGWRARA
jgi:hypothetical protein